MSARAKKNPARIEPNPEPLHILRSGEISKLKTSHPHIQNQNPNHTSIATTMHGEFPDFTQEYQELHEHQELKNMSIIKAHQHKHVDPPSPRHATPAPPPPPATGSAEEVVAAAISTGQPREHMVDGCCRGLCSGGPRGRRCRLRRLAAGARGRRLPPWLPLPPPPQSRRLLPPIAHRGRGHRCLHASPTQCT